MSSAVRSRQWPAITKREGKAAYTEPPAGPPAGRHDYIRSHQDHCIVRRRDLEAPDWRILAGPETPYFVRVVLQIWRFLHKLAQNPKPKAKNPNSKALRRLAGAAG